MSLLISLILCVVYLVNISETLTQINFDMELSLFEKAAVGDVKISSTIMYVTSATSLFDCCTTCATTIGCGSLNYNRLTVDNNCELISSGPNVTFVDLQPGWTIYYENAGREFIVYAKADILRHLYFKMSS